MEKKRFLSTLEIKSLDDESGTFEGYGAVFGNVDSYGDVIVRGAFQNSLMMMKPNMVKMLWQHDADCPVGVYDEIKEDDSGLYVKGHLLVKDVEQSREAYALLKAGAISGLSIGYSINPGGSKFSADGNRYLTDLKLWEISIVTFPANPEANVDSVKSLSTVRDFEKFLRDAGFSKNEAKTIASHGFKAITDRREAEKDSSSELLNALKTLNQSFIRS